MSVLGLGTVKLGRNAGLKYPAPFELPSDAEAMALLDACAEVGVNLLDTAPAYGSSEERLGAMLRERGDRDDWVISTKVGESFDPDTVSFATGVVAWLVDHAEGIGEILARLAAAGPSVVPPPEPERG